MPGPFPPTPGLLRLNLACDLGQVQSVVQLTRKFLLQQGCTSEEVVDIELALVEACNNAIEYVRPDAAQKMVLLEASCDAALVELQVSDHTAGFEWPTTLHLPEPDAERGRGLYLIQAVMDEVQYRRGTTQNTLVLRKKRASQ